jgi:tetratricopeptide (TPR) repeat protein
VKNHEPTLIVELFGRLHGRYDAHFAKTILDGLSLGEANMPTLRIIQSADAAGHYRAEVVLEGPGPLRQTATARFLFEMTAQDQEDLRWYLEDYLQFPHDPAPTIAVRVEQRITEVGTDLFKKVFESDEQSRRLWSKVYEQLSNIRVEIVTSVREATTIPWELIRDPYTGTVLTQRALAFVRTHNQPVETPRLVATESGPTRILLVICRPKEREDVPFRSVASRLVKTLSADARSDFQLEVLRPPTFEKLAKTLREAKRTGRPYHVVHFDGHGMYAELADAKSAAQWLGSLVPLMLSGPRQGAHGYLLFESPGTKENLQLVDGESLGKLLRETDVPVLVLNACRSAHAEPPPQPKAAESSSELQAQVGAFGSLAQEVINKGVTGVVAMRYNVYVVTAAQFVADLYAALVQGASLGEAVTLGRKQLAANPERSIAYSPRRLQDWCVPIVYEALPTAIFPKPDDARRLSITIGAGGTSAEGGSLDSRLPKPPDVGFFGRDETLLALDRAFDTQQIVLLHAYAGSGKTATAAEFARWYSLTGGLGGGAYAVLFTSFEQYTTLPRVLDRIGEVFGPTLERSGVNWPALVDDAKRREVALQVLRQVPVLWIWDNVEPVAGFPKGTKSTWSGEEQRELVDFLRDARETKAKFLLISRRDERDWLGEDLPRRILVPPMPMQERVQLAKALAERHNRKLTDVDDWRPLLRFTEGNPLTITVLARQALRDGLTNREQIEAFVEKLRRGEAAFTDEADQGRSRSLGASLDYGFKTAFTDAERKQLACLHFFQAFVNVDALTRMGDPKKEWCLVDIRGVTREQWISLLDSAAEVGLLTVHGAGRYAIHPAVPWFFKTLFDKHYPAPLNPRPPTPNPQLGVARAFVEAMGDLGRYYIWQFREGNHAVISPLEAEKANLIYARQLARTHGWWDAVIGTMQGLNVLRYHRGWLAEWARLVDEIVPDFVDSATNGPVAGREEGWRLVTTYRVRLAQETRQWAEAERLLQAILNRSRERAAPALQSPPETLDDGRRDEIRWLAVDLQWLGGIVCEQDNPKCLSLSEEAYELFRRIGDNSGAGDAAFQLGTAYLDVTHIRNLEQAELWYQRSLELTDVRAPSAQSKCHMQLGAVALQRFDDAEAAKKPEAELLGFLNSALDSYSTALKTIPSDALDDLAVTHNQLGVIYRSTGATDRALSHYRDAIRYFEDGGDVYRAATVRSGVALALADAGRLADAREYALAALRNYETCGAGAAQKVEKTKQLIAVIEQDMAKGQSS